MSVSSENLLIRNGGKDKLIENRVLFSKIMEYMHEIFEKLQRFLPAKGLLDLNLKRIDESREEGKDGEGKVDAPGQINAIERSFYDEANRDVDKVLERER